MPTGEQLRSWTITLILLTILLLTAVNLIQSAELDRLQERVERLEEER